MFTKSTKEQTSNKLLILYALECIGFPVPNHILTDIFMNNNMMHFYLFQQCLGELISLDLARLEQSPQEKKLVSITTQGKETLKFFGNDLPYTIKETLKSYIDANSSDFVRYNQIKATSKKIAEGHYRVELSIFDNDFDIINLTIDAPTNTVAEEICAKWEKQHYELFNSILGILSAKS